MDDMLTGMDEEKLRQFNIGTRNKNLPSLCTTLISTKINRSFSFAPSI